ncbi:Gfo/Idh/MocA family oxidoreductase [Paenibacillus fonticola]|uniref:Gfo/Idh/MocA family oxidoreductase n=1 Tax=Paenibacillus fonticola TaxID=379896 RepID=UPI0003783665|nr:Gfo/Idh/MocA family oxidoreductase [Paenibacillus fonticola]
MAYQNRRFDGDFLTLKKVLDSGKLGRIVEIQSHYSYFRPQSIQPGFGLLSGLAVHTIDQLVSLYGKAEKCHYDVRSIYYPGESDDYIDIDFHYGILKATVKSSLSVKSQPPKFIVHGDRGSFIKYSSGHQQKNDHGPTRVTYEREPEDNWGKLSWIGEDGSEYNELVPSEVTDYGRLYEKLYQCIRLNKEKPVKDHEVLYVLNVLDAGVAAAKAAKVS